MTGIIDTSYITEEVRDVVSRRMDQFFELIDRMIADERLSDVVPSETELRFRTVVIDGETFQLTAFQPEHDRSVPWRAGITTADADWDWLRAIEASAGNEGFAESEDALEDLEQRLRAALPTRVLTPTT